MTILYRAKFYLSRGDDPADVFVEVSETSEPEDVSELLAEMEMSLGTPGDPDCKFRKAENQEIQLIVRKSS